MMAAEVKPFCAEHSRMGEWRVHRFFNSVLPLEILIVCEQC